MALIKEITLENGVVVNYHRVVSVNNITNTNSIIEVASYTSKQKREEEKENLENGNSMNIYVHTQYMNVDYRKELNVDSAYEYLKSLDMFSGCTDEN